MIWVSVHPTARKAYVEARNFINSHEDYVVRTRKYNHFVFNMVNGDEVHFISDIEFPTWVKGRTYRFLGGRDGNIYQGWEKIGEDGN